ncbi:hypothetical protein QE152_g34308 [Popillia japonica]|uniref:DDE-1 domain-containing protein n=1 Tax=Popillia japonica TaxID=7064 RepID=A0AAW1IUG5_POPJA
MLFVFQDSAKNSTLKCYLFSEEARKSEFDGFWKLSWKEKKFFVQLDMKLGETQRHRDRKEEENSQRLLVMEKMLPCYVVYKSKNLYSTWIEGAPKGTRFNCTQSGWFDSTILEDWVKTIALSYMRRLPGRKYFFRVSSKQFHPPNPAPRYRLLQTIKDRTETNFAKMEERTSQEERRRAKTKLNVVAGQSVGLESESNTDSIEPNDDLAAELEKSDESELEVLSMHDKENEDVNDQECVEKFGKKFQNVKPVNANEIEAGDWLLVSFSPENKRACSSKMLYFVCCVERKNDDVEFQGKFLRGKTTVANRGFIYHFPEVEDVSNFHVSQIIGKLDEPEKSRRGEFKFKLNFHYL